MSYKYRQLTVNYACPAVNLPILTSNLSPPPRSLLQRNGKRHSAIQLKREGFEGMKTRIREKIGQRRLGVEAGNHNQGWKQSRFRLFWTLVLPVFGLGGLQCAAQSTPNFGPNVIIIDPSMPSTTINST